MVYSTRAQPTCSAPGTSSQSAARRSLCSLHWSTLQEVLRTRRQNRLPAYESLDDAVFACGSTFLDYSTVQRLMRAYARPEDWYLRPIGLWPLALSTCICDRCAGLAIHRYTQDKLLRSSREPRSRRSETLSCCTARAAGTCRVRQPSSRVVHTAAVYARVRVRVQHVQLCSASRRVALPRGGVQRTPVGYAPRDCRRLRTARRAEHDVRSQQTSRRAAPSRHRHAERICSAGDSSLVELRVAERSDAARVSSAVLHTRRSCARGTRAA